MASDSPAQDGPPPLGLTWGIKRSFIKYMRELPDGAVSATDGAEMLDSGFFNFPPGGGDYDPAAGTGTLRFSGDVRMSGHYGMLFVRITDPWVSFSPTGGVLSIPAGDANTAADAPERIPLVTFNAAVPRVAGEHLVWQSVEAFLTPEGREVFNGQYETFQAMDPLSIRVPAPGRR
jgi:hypothetical protein